MRYRIKLVDGTITEVDASMIKQYNPKTKRNIKVWDFRCPPSEMGWSVDIYFQSDISEVTDDHGRDVNIWEEEN